MRVITHEAVVVDTERSEGELVECAACGYEPPHGRIPVRCPRCFAHSTFHRVIKAGKAWDDLIATRSRRISAEAAAIGADEHGTSDAPSAMADSRPVTLALFCHAQQTYVLIRPEHGGVRLVPLHRRRNNNTEGADEWCATLRLHVGIYRLRFYVDDGRCLREAEDNEDAHGGLPAHHRHGGERLLVVRQPSDTRVRDGAPLGESHDADAIVGGQQGRREHQPSRLARGDAGPDIAA
jgi:hypothetical protein